MGALLHGCIMLYHLVPGPNVKLLLAPAGNLERLKKGPGNCCSCKIAGAAGAHYHNTDDV